MSVFEKSYVFVGGCGDGGSGDVWDYYGNCGGGC